MFTKQTFKTHGTSIGNIIFWLFFTVLYTYFLFRGAIEKASAIESLSNTIWLVVCIFQILKSRKKILYIPSDNNPDRNTEENEIDIRSIEVTALIIVGIICFIPVSLILWVNRLELVNPYIVEPEFEVYGIYSNISAGLFLIVQDL